ncbi:MAG: T9SS type A sorting domain-containing protein [Bacteroidota bacterium]
MINRLLLCAAYLLIGFGAHAQFTTDTLQNTVIQSLAGSEQSVPISATTPTGQTYVSWFDNSSGQYVLRMQLLDANGNGLWGSGGMIVSSFPQSTALFRYDMAADANGNAVVAFQDERSGSLKVVAYKLNAAGNFLWGNNGVSLVDSTADGLGPAITFVDNGDAIVAWNANIGSAKWISMQRIGSTGNIVWSKRIQDNNKYSRPDLIPSGSDGFILLYVKETGSFPAATSTLFAQRYNGTGNGTWANPVQLSSKTTSFFFFPQIVSDGNGGGFTLFDTSNPANPALIDVYAQHVSATGSLWSATGTQLANSTTDVKLTGGFCYESGSNTLCAAIQILNSSQSNSGFSLQRVDAAGTVLLGANAFMLKPVSPTYYRPLALVSAAGSLMLLYQQGGGFGTQLLNAMKTDLSGAPLWGYDPTFCATPSSKDDLTAGAFTNNQVVAVWSDDRLGIGSDLGIYAQNIDINGNYGVLTGIDQPITASDIRIFPNPGRYASLLVSSDRAERAELRLYSLSGKLLHTDVLNLQAGENRFPLPLAESREALILELQRESGVSRLRWIR